MSSSNSTSSAPSAGTPMQWLLRVVQGILIGIGAMLPGISGGALSVLFGIYQPMMALLSHPFKAFKKYILLFIPVILGVGLGFVGSAKLLATFFEANELMMVCLFVGLIVGVLPSLFREASARGKTVKGKTSLGISFIVMLGVLLFLTHGVKLSITPNFVWFIVCGIVWGLSMVVPGLSSSNILIFLSLYQPMSAGIGSLDMMVVLPMGMGFAATVLLLARPINAVFESHYEEAYHCIIGTVLASTVMIIPTQFPSLSSGLMGLGVAVIGFIFALLMDKWAERIKGSQNA